MAVEQIKMPQLGESVTEGTITKWFVSSGDSVNKYDSLAEVMTDKVTAEIPSSFTGVIKTLIANEGDTLSVGEVICSMEVEEATDSKNADSQKDLIKEEAVSHIQSNKARYSPAVLKISREYGLDLETIKGSGAGGRITRKDLLKLIESGKHLENNGPQLQTLPQDEIKQKILLHSESKPSISAKKDIKETGDIEVPVTGIRKVIAANMIRSKHEVPHAWTMIEVDVTDLVEYRNSIKDEFRIKEGFNLTFFAFFVKAAAQALKEFPQINSMWAGERIIQKRDINISIAVAKEDALYVPVIRNADDKSIKGIAREISELAEKVRTGKISSDDMAGGTFTVNNTGTFGSVQSMGIINYPQAAILQVESIVKRPIVMNDNMIAIRDMVNLCLSLDHRILDGLVCGRFLKRVKDILESTTKTTTSIY